MRAARLVAVVAIGVVGVAGATASRSTSDGDDVGVTFRLAAKSSPSSGAVGSFAMAGNVEGLYPSDVATTTLTVTVNNPNSFALVVSNLTVTVGDASRGCGGSNVVVGAPGGSFSVAPRAAVVRALPVRLAKAAPDACQAASFPLTYTATAVKQ